MTTFFLVRHAERDSDPDLLPGRAPGIRLTEHGRAQAEWIAEVLGGHNVGKVVSSPLERAIETAAPLARVTGRGVIVAEAFNEIDFGSWTGRRVADLEPDPVWRNFNRFRSGTRIPGGELAGEVQNRFVRELLRLRADEPDGCVACISHADPIRFALMHFLGAPIDRFDRIEIAPGSITTVTLAEWGARIVRMNETP